MRKKQLIEQLAALREKQKAEQNRIAVAADGGENVSAVEVLAAVRKIEAEIETADAELKAIEELEARAKKNAEAAAIAADAGRQRTEVHNNAEDKPFKSIGEFLGAVHVSMSPNGQMDPRFQQFAPSGASNIVPSDGIPVPETVLALIYNKGFGPGSIAGRCDRMTVSGKVKIPTVKETSRATGSRWGGVQVYRRNEGDTVSATRPKFDFLEMEAESMMGLCYATEEMLADQRQMEGIFMRAFGEEFSFSIDDEVMSGNGAGKMLGIMNAPCLVTVNKETGQAAATIVYQNLVKMFTRMPAGLRSGAVWLVNQDVEPQLWAMEFPVGTGGVPAFLPPGGAADQPFARLFGRPIIPVEQCQTLGTAGDIVLANLGEYLIIDRQGVQSDSSMHVRFLYNEMTFRWTLRNNGQPKWKSAITPFKGTSTVSPFIALQTRA